MYFEAVGYGISLFIVAQYVISQSFSIGTTVWLGVWSDANEQVEMNNTTMSTADRDTYLGVYGALGFGHGKYLFMFGAKHRIS